MIIWSVTQNIITPVIASPLTKTQSLDSGSQPPRCNLPACFVCLITSLASSMFSGHSTQTFFYLEFSTIHSTLGMFSRYKEVSILVRPPSGAPYSPSLWPPSPQNYAIPDILNSLFTLPIQPYPTYQARRKLLTVGSASGNRARHIVRVQLTVHEGWGTTDVEHTAHRKADALWVLLIIVYILWETIDFYIPQNKPIKSCHEMLKSLNNNIVSLVFFQLHVEEYGTHLEDQVGTGTVERRGTQSSVPEMKRHFLIKIWKHVSYWQLLFYLENNLKYSLSVHLCLWMEHKHLMFSELNNVTI